MVSVEREFGLVCLFLAESEKRVPGWILTPHPGEAARLVDSTSKDIQADRLAAVDQISRQYDGTAVLKGAGTLVSAADGPPWISLGGNPGMAAPGMGDVLSGVIAAMLAQGIPAENAAKIGVEIHARAGDSASADGERGMLARDLVVLRRGGDIRGVWKL